MATSQLPLTFRAATAADAQRLIALVRSAYRGEESRAGWTTEADLLDDDRIDEAGMLAKINSPDGVVILAFRSDATSPGRNGNGKDEGTLTACCEVTRKDSTAAFFGMFAVSPKLQAGGVGRRVLERAEKWAREEWGMQRIEMCVVWLRKELISWYERRGYRRTGRTEPFPYENMVNYEGRHVRDDLYFLVLGKELYHCRGGDTG